MNDISQLLAFYLDIPDMNTFIKIMLRLVTAMVVGALIGLERERFFKDMNKTKAAGFRTYALVCFGSALFGIASIYGFSSVQTTPYGTIVDPGRIAAQIVVGISWIGTAIIIKGKEEVKGLTTSAGIWVVAAIGLLLSSKLYIFGLIAALLSYLLLDFHRLFPRLFRNFTRTPDNIEPDISGEPSDSKKKGE